MKRFFYSLLLILFLATTVNASFLGTWQVDDYLTFVCNTHTASTGAATDADSVPTYRVYEDETGTALLTGSMAKLDDAGTTGFYSEQIQLTAGNGFEEGKCYSVYVSATVASVVGTISHTFQVEPSSATATQIVDEWETQSQADPTGFHVNIKEWSGSAVSALATKADIVDAVWDEDIVAAHNSADTSGALLDSPADWITATGFSTHAAADVWAVGTRALTDKAGFSLSASGIDGIWDETITGHATADSFGKVFDDQIDGLRAYGDSGWATATGFSTHSAADVWSVGTRALTDKAGFTISGTKTTLDALNDVSTADVNAQCDTALSDIGLDHLLAASVIGADITDNSIVAYIVSKSATADWDSFVNTTDSLEAIADGGSSLTAADVWNYDIPTNYAPSGTSAGSVLDKLTEESTTLSTDVALGSVAGQLLDNGTAWTYDRTTDSLEAIRDRGDAAWTTGGGASISDILQVVPLVPFSINIADTATIRMGMGLANALDDLPSTAEIDPGTITIDRMALGGSSWSNVVNAAACSEVAGVIYYDEVFDATTGYRAGDSLRITFKSQKITVDANDYEIVGTDGWSFYTCIGRY